MEKFEQVNFIRNHIFVLKIEFWEVEIEIELIWIVCYIKWKIKKSHNVLQWSRSRIKYYYSLLDIDKAKIMTSDKIKVRSQ